MSPESLLTLIAWSYGIAAAVFIAFLAQLVAGWRGGRRARWLLFAVATSGLWACAVFVAAVGFPAVQFGWIPLVESARTAAWLAFIGSLLAGEAARRSRVSSVVRRSTIGWLPLLILILLLGRIGTLGFVVREYIARPERVAYASAVGLAICGLVLLEQLYRRTPLEARWGVKPLCLGLAIGFGFELVLYADALLFSRVDADLWAALGFVTALGVPFVAVSTARNKQWTVDVAISRRAVAFSISLVASGAYLLLSAGAGYFLKYFGGSWGKALQATFLAAAVLFFVALVSSGSTRAKLRVLISKHFFSYRFDYREEWLRFTRTLSARGAGGAIYVQCIKAVADLVESPAGRLWIKRGDEYVPVGRWNLPAVEGEEPFSGDLPRFLESTGWIVDIRECREEPEKYGGVSMPESIGQFADGWLLVPLIAGEELAGVVLLCRPRTSIELDWEVRDALKVAGRQAATYVVQAEATGALLEAEKFDAFNRMSAFVVHDLKNLVSQLTLLLKNAERHYQNPEFQRDMLATVRNVVARMSDLMLQLRTGATPPDAARPVELRNVVGRIRDAKGLQGRNLVFEQGDTVFGIGHEDRLEHVIGHVVQNAIDATPAEGRVTLRLYGTESTAVVEVEDNGAGMSEEFMAVQLFRPFQTTKPHGMGIGMYESRQYVQSVGGRMEVESAVGRGTMVRVILARHKPDRTGVPDLHREAA